MKNPSVASSHLGKDPFEINISEKENKNDQPSNSIIPTKDFNLATSSRNQKPHAKLEKNSSGKSILQAQKTKSKVLTHYFSKDLTNPDSENFFGNGILLHKLRTSTHARYFNALSLLKDADVRTPPRVSPDAARTMQISLLLIQALMLAGWPFADSKKKYSCQRRSSLLL
jgi:hypothetical protein